MKLHDLHARLLERGIIDVPRGTLRNWCFIGARINGRHVKMRSVKIGGLRMSSVLWFRDFYELQDRLLSEDQSTPRE